MKTSPDPIYLKDYLPPAYLVIEVELNFDLYEDRVEVASRLVCGRNKERGAVNEGLVLYGQDLLLKEISLDGKILVEGDYVRDAATLTLHAVPEEFVLEIKTEIYPQKNTALEGLYKSSGNFCTQCEAEGFRKITYFQDRPDVLARYTVRITADREQYPVLLANGNLIDSGELAQGRHFASWLDPFPKPSYLFALVAGRLVKIGDNFVTGSGRNIALEIYVEPHNRDKCDHAMASLKKAMAWDEETFELEYDLDQYMIVAVDDFNMGAMENKGLNVFNSKYVLAKPDTATDSDYEGIEAVIAHEYFHNWTGNRVTCRDWFQLSLKEGLTVFRDQLFTADMISPAVKRIHDVRMLRNLQFPEDNGPMAHPVRPASYIEINNFYTVTVYEKGAEVVRMLHTLLGAELFKKGLALYLGRHDGRAATCDDFVRAMAEVSGRDLTRFKNWYNQAGTPQLFVAGEYDAARQIYTLTIRQESAASPGQSEKDHYHIPVAIGLLAADGGEILLQRQGQNPEQPGLLELYGEEEVFRFINVPEEPVVSLLRNFSAPVKLDYQYRDEELLLLMTNDHDLFNRWEAAQRFSVRLCLELIADFQQQRELSLRDDYVEVFKGLLVESNVSDKAFFAQMITLPSEEYLGEQMAVVDVDAIHAVRRFVRQSLATSLEDEFTSLYHANHFKEPYRYDPGSAGERAIKNLCLAYLMTMENDAATKLCLAQFDTTDNMTDQLAAFSGLAHSARPERHEVVARFYEQWQSDALVLDKWFAVQATAPQPTTLGTVVRLLEHPAFQMKNPNKVRALIGSFAAGNPICFHDATGAGYRFLADRIILLDGINPQIASRLTARFSRWQRYDQARQQMMRLQLERILAKDQLSSDVYEIASKSLAAF
ncbi:MAG: aminopeptidase N [Desulfobulbaceae bacterium]|nr:aminopeptidase N [Desulfobulbaceae bacterium]HIJ78133.1 aminopeptidase N [Deltaproteobacteria bacterium]